MVVVKEGPYYQAEQAASAQNNGSSSSTTSNGTSSSGNSSTTSNTSNMEPKQEYNYIENKCGQEAETAGYLEILRRRITELENGKLENDHVTLFLTSAIPKITKSLLKHRFMDDDLGANVHNFYKQVLHLVANYIQNGTIVSYPGLLTAMTHIFDNDNNYYLSKGKPSMEEQDQFAVFPTNNKWASYWLVELVEFFGRRGGYDIVLDFLKSLTVPAQSIENSSTGNNTPQQPVKSSLPLVIALLEPLWNIIHNGYFVPEVLGSHMERIQGVVLPYLMGVSNDELKQFKKDELDALFKLLNKMLEAVYPVGQVGEIMEKFQLDFALKCFLSPIFDKRIYGLGYINDVIGLLRHTNKEQTSTSPKDTDNATSHALVVYQPPAAPPLPKDTRWIDAPFLVNWLQRNQLVELIFGKSAQPVILQKSGDIFGFLGKNDALSRDQIDMIWKCATTVHEAFLPILFKVIGDNCGDLQISHVQQLYECLQSIPRNTLTSIYLQLLRDFSKGVADSDQRLMCMNLLYDIMVDQTPTTGPPLDISQLAMYHLSELVKQQVFRPHRHAWLAKCIQNVRQNVSVAFCLDLMGQIFSSYPPKPPSKDSIPSNGSNGTNTNAPLAGTADGASTSSNNGTSGTSSQPVENVSVVDIIKKIEKEFSFFDLFFEELVNFKNTAVTNVANVNRDQYDPNTLVLSGRLDYISEVKTRLRLLLFVLNHYETILDYEKYEIVWDNLIVRAVTYLEYDECFQWFISARVEPYPNALVAIDDKNASLLFKNKMLKISTVGATSLAFKCVQRYFLDANIKDKKIEWKDIKEEDFEVLDLDLVGYSFIWDILLNVYNLDVVTACSEFLVKIQTKISPKVVEKVGKKKLREQFVTLCLNYLQRSADGAIKASVDGATNDVERRSERCLSLLIAFCDQCQVEAGYKIKSHGTSTRGKPIKLLFLNSVLNSYPAAFSVSTHTNEQISTIKARVKDIINYQGPLKHLYFSIQRVSIPLADESKSLHDLKIHSTASSFDYSQTSDTSNIYPNNRYVITVHEIPHLPKGQETVNRSRAGNGSPKVEKKDPADAAEKAKQLMEVGGITETAALVALRRADWDVNAGVLLLTDEQQRKEIVEEAEKLAEEASLTETNKGPIDEKVLQELPSYILSHSEEFFNQIFKLLNLNNESISNKVWHLLLSMPTSKSTLETIHAIGREDSRIDWDSLFDIKSSYKLLYILQIIDTTIFAVEDSLSSDSRVKWCNQFLAKGGFLQLYKILSTQDWFAAPKLSHSQDKTNTEAAIQQKSCLALILKILDFFLHAVIDKGLDYRNNEDAFVIQIKQSHVSFSGMLDHVDSAATIEKLLMIVWNCASKAVPDVDDAVVTYAMRLIVLLILSDPSKLSVLYNYKSFDTFVLRTILECREFSIRSAAAEGFYQLCAHVIVPSGKVSTPHSYFLKLLLNNMPDHMSTNYNVWATCGQYFHLLDRLIDDACSGKDGENPKKYQDLLVQLVHFLKQRPIVELRNSDIVDEILIGLISLITTLVRHEPSFRFLVGQQHGLVQELYHNGLFGLKAGPSSSSPPKCKARLSRIYAFQLLVELGKNQENYAQLLTLLEGHHGGGTRVATWEYHPSADDKPTNGYVGLRNLGNTCYINSLFQQFFMMPSVRDGFLHIEEPGTDKEKKESLAYQIQNIFGYLQESEKASFDPAGFCAAYKDWEGRPTNVHQQQDVDEFFKILWQRLEGQLKGTQHEKLLTNVFGGKMCTELRSVEKEYPYVSEREEDFITLSLDIKGKPNIEAALDAFVKADKLEGDNAYFCEQYQRKVDATTRCYIKKLTNTVILHLKRFDFDFTNYKKNKVNDYCEFPLFLNMKPWTKDGIGQKELGEMTDNTDPEYAYELMGVLVHSGGADAGHYYSYIKERDAKFGERKWFEFNDKVVSDFNIQDLAGECFGGTQLVTHWDNWSRQYVKRTYDRVRSAYMLFYDKVKVENSPVQSNQVPDPKIDTSFITNLTTAANQSQEAPQDHPTFINGVPYNIYKHVWTENAEFLRDRQLFDATYFDFMLQLSKIANVTPVTEYTIDPNSLSDDPTFRAIKLGTRFVFETLAHAKENDTYFHWIEQLKSLYQIHVPACKWLLNHLMRGSLLHDLLLECSIERIRFGAADLIGHVLRTLVPYEHPFYFEVEEALKVTDSATGAVSIAPVGSVATEGPDAPKTELVKVPRALTVLFMDNVFSLLEESRNYWRRFKQYFRVIRDFASISHYQRQYFISRQLVSVYAEYFMGKTKKGQTKRANVMDRFNLPDLVEFIDALSVIVRGCETGALKEKGYPPTTVNDGVVLQLPNREKKELWDKTFFTSMLEMDYNTRGATEIIIHSSWEDLKRTKWVMDLLLGEISKSWMSDKFAVFEALLTPLILLQDSLQNTRIIMALSPFGSPGSPKGVLAIIHELHAQNAKYVLMLIKFLMHLATNPAVASYLSKQAREMMWIEQFLESKVGNATGADEEMGTSDDTETVDVDATPLNGDPEVIEYGPHLPGSNGTSQKSETRPRRDSIYVSYVSVKKFLQEHGVQQEPNFDKERELVEEIDSLKRENARLKEALEYYRQKAPDVKPPTFMTTKEWEQGRTNGGGKIRIDEDDQDDESRMDDGENQMEMETISTAVVTTVTSSQPQGESQLSPEIQEKVAQLTAIFSNVPEQIAILALKKMDNDVENAAFLLSDDISITELMKEASEADATSNPNKKQKTSSPEDNKVSNGTFN